MTYDSGAVPLTVKDQIHSLKDMTPSNTVWLSTLGLDHPQGIQFREGRNWRKIHTCRQDTFLLNALEGFSVDRSVGYTRQEDFIKINFWLSGRHTTALDGFVQHEHEKPEIFITAGPPEMVKLDMQSGESKIESVALCLRREFFPQQMGLALEDLPQPLRGIFLPETAPFAFHRFSFTPDLTTAARSILTTPAALRLSPVYLQAKAIELMCLLIHRICAEEQKPTCVDVQTRWEPRLQEARDFLLRNYAEDITLKGLSRMVGLNKLALTSGFRALFGQSVYDFLQKRRMERALELLQEGSQTVMQVAQAVGYAHASNFSTAFHNYYGCAPHKVRGSRVHRN